MNHCEYWDAGWCYSPKGVKNNASSSGACLEPKNCPHLIAKECRQTGRTNATTNKLLKLSETQMTEMYGGNTPIVPEETIEKWEKDQFISLCKKLVDDLDAWMEYDAQPSRLPKEYRNTLELIMEARRFIKERRK